MNRFVVTGIVSSCILNNAELEERTHLEFVARAGEIRGLKESSEILHSDNLVSNE